MKLIPLIIKIALIFLTYFVDVIRSAKIDIQSHFPVSKITNSYL